MWLWIVIIVSGICAFFSFYMTYLASRIDADGVFLFTGFGLLFIIPFLLAAIKAASNYSTLFKRVNEIISMEPRAVSFVSHRFMMSALLTFVLVFLPSFLSYFIREISGLIRVTISKLLIKYELL